MKFKFKFKFNDIHVLWAKYLLVPDAAGKQRRDPQLLNGRPHAVFKVQTELSSGHKCQLVRRVLSEPEAARTIRSQFIFPCVHTEGLIVACRARVRQQCPFALNESARLCEKNNPLLYFSSTDRKINKNVFLTRPDSLTHRKPLSPTLSSLLSVRSHRCQIIQCTQSEGQLGQVPGVVLQQAIFLSLPKVSECMADRSEL